MVIDGVGSLSATSDTMKQSSSSKRKSDPASFRLLSKSGKAIYMPQKENGGILEFRPLAALGNQDSRWK